MAVVKMSISLDPQLDGAVRSSAAAEGSSLSEWLAEAASARLRAEGLSRYLDAWEAENGALTEAELAAADRALGLPIP